MSLYNLYAILGMSAKFSCRAILAYFGIAFVLPVSVFVGGTIFKCMIFWADNTIKMFIINKLPPFVSLIIDEDFF